MSDLFDQVSEDQDPFKKLASKLPGFSGYIERENRRAADKLLRESIADRYEMLWKKLSDLQKDLASDGELDALDELENAAMKIQTFKDKVRTAAYGNSGFFDAIKVNEEELARLYEYDLMLLEQADEIERAIDNVETSIGEDGFPAAVSHLVSLSRDLVAAFESRSSVITSSESA
ncbi:MAG: hypothetical protein DWG76_08005 [Chloroflexi bacterium]|nr:hypothetical protein [Chloroflexota bacterium]MQC27370.1 hypothetical protein [Chloroflexota bacterium]